MDGGVLAGLCELLLPRACVVCGSAAGEGATSGLDAALCPACLATLRPLLAFRCPLCSLPFAGEGVSHPCPSCLKRPPPFSRLAAWGVYGGSLKEAIHRFKYGGDLALRGFLEELCLTAALENFSGTGFSATVPVPCHKSGLARRGYDLPALLALRLAKEFGAPFRPAALKKTDGEIKMAGLGLRERKKAVRGLFEAGEQLSGRILLVDDVATSLSTLRLCAKKCREAGAVEVMAVAVARAPVDSVRR